MTVTVYEDGKVIDNFALPEGGNYTWETSDYGIHNGIPLYLYPSSHASLQMVLPKQDVPRCTSILFHPSNHSLGGVFHVVIFIS